MASPVVFSNGVKFFEWTGTKFINAPNIAGAADIPSYVGDMLVLPTGQVLLTTQGAVSPHPQVLVYNARGTYKPAWAPTITSVPTTITRGTVYVIKGAQFNGLSQGAAYGDDTQSATNYALVRDHQQSNQARVLRSDGQPQHHGSCDGQPAGVHAFHRVGPHGDGRQQFGRSHKRYPVRRSCGDGAVAAMKALVTLQSTRLPSRPLRRGRRVDFFCFSESPRMGTTLSQRLSEIKAT